MAEGIRIAGGGKSEGQYVWKKLKKQDFTLSFSVTNSSSPYNLVVNCNQIDLTTVSASFFVGIKGVWNSTGYYKFTDENTLTIYDGSNTYDFTATWNASTKTWLVNSASGIGTTAMFADYSSEIKTFIDYVVSDKSTAYPDGGMQGGYWYEKGNCGTNVWSKKTFVPAQTLINPTIIFSSSRVNNHEVLTATSASFNQHGVTDWLSFLNGFTKSSSYFSVSGSNLYWNYNSAQYQFTIEVNDNGFPVLTAVESTYLNVAAGTYEYSGTKNIPLKALDTVGYVVSDEPDAYPNGSVDGDYYYELLAQVASANVMSLSDNAVATVQQDYRNTIETEVSNANS